MNLKVISLALLVAIVMVTAGCTTATTMYNDPSTLETKTITIAESYPRQDTYQYHYDPYVVTTDHEIYSIPSDKVWAQLPRGSTHLVRFNRLSIPYESRERDGLIREVLS